VAEQPFAIEPLDRPRAYRISGPLDVPSAGGLPELLDDLCRTPGDITLDLSGVTYMDSGGLRALIQACMGLGRTGSVRIANPSDQVRRLLDLSGVEANVDNLVVE
jgi:anti-anti-sigma factor